MKKHFLVSLLIITALAVAGIAYAITTRTVVPGETQDIAGTAPKKAGNVCVVKAIHHAADSVTFNLYTSNRWYGKAVWQVVKSSDATAFPVQRVLGDNTTGTVGDHGDIVVNREYSTYKLKPFGNNTSASLTFCQDRQ